MLEDLSASALYEEIKHELNFQTCSESFFHDYFTV